MQQEQANNFYVIKVGRWKGRKVEEKRGREAENKNENENERKSRMNNQIRGSIRIGSSSSS